MSAPAAKPKAGKEPTAKIGLIVPAGQANPAPPIGPALGQHGLNIMEFCKAFNEKSKSFDPGAPIPVSINVYKDRSFDFTMKAPTITYFIMKELKIQKGSTAPGRTPIGQITMKQCKKIAEQKMVDLNANDLDAAAKIVAGSARSMGLTVVEG